jgi:hypothetical protein
MRRASHALDKAAQILIQTDVIDTAERSQPSITS